jgi:hypothetical protein
MRKVRQQISGRSISNLFDTKIVITLSGVARSIVVPERRGRNIEATQRCQSRDSVSFSEEIPVNYLMRVQGKMPATGERINPARRTADDEPMDHNFSQKRPCRLEQLHSLSIFGGRMSRQVLRSS